MSVGDFDSQWERVIRRRTLLSCVSLGVGAVMSLVMAGLVASIFTKIADTGAMGDGRWLVWAIGVSMSAAMVVSIWWVQRRQRMMFGALDRFGWRVCPMCLREMTRRDDGGDDGDARADGDDGDGLGEGDDEVFRCVHCSRTAPARFLREIWESLGVATARATQMRGKYRRRKADQELPESLTKRRLITSAVWATGSCVLIGVIIAMLTGRSLLVGAVMYLPYMVFFGGIVLFTLPMHRRGEQRQCATCDYAAPPKPPVPVRCPECGGDWTKLGALVRGEKVGDRRHMWAGALIAVVGMVLLIGVKVDRFVFRALPTSSLIRQIGESGGFQYDEWAELQTRTLTAEQAKELAIRLLDKRERRGYLSAEDGAWLEGQYAAGALPADLARRYVVEHVKIALSAPAVASPGEPVGLHTKRLHRQGMARHAVAFLRPSNRLKCRWHR